MSLPRVVISGFRELLRKRETDRDLDDELQSYVEFAGTDKMQRGMSQEKALRSARLDLGSRESIKEEVRCVGWEHVVESVWQDVCHATRVLAKHRQSISVLV